MSFLFVLSTSVACVYAWASGRENWFIVEWISLANLIILCLVAVAINILMIISASKLVRVEEYMRDRGGKVYAGIALAILLFLSMTVFMVLNIAIYGVKITLWFGFILNAIGTAQDIFLTLTIPHTMIDIEFKSVKVKDEIHVIAFDTNDKEMFRINFGPVGDLLNFTGEPTINRS
jgi:hypothetical protein